MYYILLYYLNIHICIIHGIIMHNIYGASGKIENTRWKCFHTDLGAVSRVYILFTTSTKSLEEKIEKKLKTHKKKQTRSVILYTVATLRVKKNKSTG